jgi:hypothetical protein
MKSRYFVILAILTLLVVIIGGCSKKAAPTGPSVPTTPTPEPTPAPEPQAPVETEMPVEEAPESGEEVAQPAESTLGLGDDVTAEKVETKDQTDLAVDAQTTSEVFSEVGCADGRITVQFTNTGDKTWSIVQQGVPKKSDVVNVAIMNRGVVDITPGCTAYDLEPGDSVVCSEIDMGVIPGDNRVSVNTPSGTVAKIVVC